MSVSSFVLGGIGGGSTVALFITEGFGNNAAPAPANVVLGGVPKRRGKRFEITINDQKFIAPSVPALEALVIAWRRKNPANDRVAKPKPIPAPAKRIPETVVLADAGVTTPSWPERREARATILYAPTVPASVADALRQAVIAQEAQAAKMLADEEDDIEALMAILRVAA